MHDWFTKTGQGVGRGVPLRRRRRRRRATSAPTGCRRRQRDLETDGGTTTLAGRPQLRDQRRPRSCCRRHPRARRASTTSPTSRRSSCTTPTSTRRRGGSGPSTAASPAPGPASASPATFSASELFTTETDSIVNGYAPSVTANLSSKRLGMLPLYVAVQQRGEPHPLHRNDAATAETDIGLSRFDVTPTFRAALTQLAVPQRQRHRRLSPHLLQREPRRRAACRCRSPLTRRYFDLRADLVGPVFSRVFTPNNALADRLKHVIEPNVSIQRITDFENSGPRRARRRARTTSSFGGRHPHELRADQPHSRAQGAGRSGRRRRRRSAPRELLSIGADAELLHRPARQPVRQLVPVIELQPSAEPSSFSPIALTVRTAPTAFSTGTLRLEYDSQIGACQQLQRHRQQQLPRGASRRRLEHARAFDATSQRQRAERLDDAQLHGRHAPAAPTC